MRLEYNGIPVPTLGVRAWVLKRDDHQCQFGGPLHGDDLHLDHIWPRALGGDDSLINLWMLCVTCNLQKGASHPMDWIAGTYSLDRKPHINNMEHPHNRFWFQLATACYHAERRGLWVWPDLSLWDLTGVEFEGIG